AKRAWDKKAVAWTAQRQEYDPITFNLDEAKVVDMGADIFCAQPWVWHEAYRNISTQYRIGHSMWDNWLLGFLTLTFKRRFVDLTKLNPIFHPRHSSRIQPFLVNPPRDRFIESGVGFPMGV